MFLLLGILQYFFFWARWYCVTSHVKMGILTKYDDGFTWHQLAKLRPTTPEEVVEVLKKVSSQTSNALPSFLNAKNISKHLPFHLEKLLFGSFQKGMLGEIFFACGSLVIYFRGGGGSQETHQQKHTYHPQKILSLPGRSI